MMQKILKYSLPLIITLLLVSLLLRNGIHLDDLRSILDRSQKGWLALALLSMACAYGAVTWLNEILLKRFNARVPYGEQFLIQLAMAFIETVVPSAAISGVILRARLLKPHGVSADVATATTLVETTLLTASLILPGAAVVCIAMVEGIPGFGLLSNWIFFISGVIIMIVLTNGKWNAAVFVDIKARAIQATSRFWEQAIQPRWPTYFEHWPAQRVNERIQYLWSESIASIQAQPISILLSLLTHFIFEALCLAMCFYALGQKLPLTTLFLLYPLTIAINTFGTVPGGIGLAEVSLSALYVQFGIAIEAAISLAITYRVMGYWFPRVAGGLAWLWIERENPA